MRVRGLFEDIHLSQPRRGVRANVSRLLRPAVLWIFLGVLKPLNLLLRPLSTKSALVLTPNSPLNRGDEAVCKVVIDFLSRLDFRSEIILESPDGGDVFEGVTVVGAKGSLYKLSRFRFSCKLLLHMFGKWVTLILATDVLDGKYDPEITHRKLTAVYLSQLLGIRTQVIGACVTTPLDARIADKLSYYLQGAKIFARDFVSFNFFQRQGFRDAEYVADPAFLLKAESSQWTRPIEKWIEGHRAKGNVVIGINVSTFALGKSMGHGNVSELVFEERLRKLAMNTDRLLSELGISLIYLPHVFLPYDSDIDTHSKIVGLFRGKQNGCVLNIIDRLHSWELRQVVSRLDALVASRMHLAISGLSMQVPTLCIAYSSKYEGMLNHFDLGDSIIHLRELDNNEWYFYDKVEWFLSMREEIKEKISSQLATVCQRAALNFSCLHKE